ELEWPQLMSNGEISRPRWRCQTSAPFMSSATTWPVPNHAYTRSPSVTGLGDARLCLSWTGCSGPSASSRYCYSRRPSARLKASTRKKTLSPSDAVLLSDRSPAPAGSEPCDSRGPCRLAPDPSCEVTNTVLPQTIGDEAPTPASEAFQATLSVALQRSGRF